MVAVDPITKQEMVKVLVDLSSNVVVVAVMLVEVTEEVAEVVASPGTTRISVMKAVVNRFPTRRTKLINQPR